MEYEIKEEFHKEQNFLSKYLQGCYGAVVPALLSERQHTCVVKAAAAGIAPGVRHRAGVPPGVSVAEGAHAEPDCAGGFSVAVSQGPEALTWLF